MSLLLRAQAKVNLHLRVRGRRPDGYHDLLTLFDRISLADRLTLTVAGAGVALVCEGPVPAGPGNLAWRGAAAALEAAGSKQGVSLELVKGVPAGAGLGGGSSDAAAALVGTDRLLQLKLGETRLLQLGRALGADVPFFVKGLLTGRERFMAVGRGVGEVLEEVPSPPALVYLLMNPGFEVSTASVFKAGGFPLVSAASEASPVPRGSGPVTAAPEADKGIDGAVPRTRKEILALLRNDLEPVTSGLHPEVEAMLVELRRAGALGARMSGSGPTVFGLFLTVEDAQRAKSAIEARVAGSRTRVFLAEGE